MIPGCCTLLQRLTLCRRFTPAIQSINADLQQFADSRDELHFVDCGQGFTYDGDSGRIHAALMPDGVNLNRAGMEQLASCLDPITHVRAQSLVVTTVKQCTLCSSDT